MRIGLLDIVKTIGMWSLEVSGPGSAVCENDVWRSACSIGYIVWKVGSYMSCMAVPN